MVGYPNFLNTKEDYIYVHDNFQKEQWLPDFQALLDTMKDWLFDHVVADGEMYSTFLKRILIASCADLDSLFRRLRN